MEGARSYSIIGAFGETADAHVEASKSFETWTFQACDVRFDDEQPVIHIVMDK